MDLQLNVDGLGSLIGGICAAVALAGTAWQYFIQKRRREFEVASSLVSALSTDEVLHFAVTCVDWGRGLIPVPQRWEKIIGSPCITHHVPTFGKAVEIKLLPQVSTDPQAMLYRHSFVALFDHLERIQQQLDHKAIHLEDLDSLGWLARQLEDWPYAKIWGLDGKTFFMNAARAWYDRQAPARLIALLAQRNGLQLRECARSSSAECRLPKENVPGSASPTLSSIDGPATARE
jgi:hypothetical protein